MEGKIAALLFLSFMSLEDFKEKSVSVWKILLFLAAGLTYLLVFQTVLWSQSLSLYTLIALLPGIALLLLTKISQGAIGAADGLIVLGLGLWLGFWELLGVLSGAFFISAFVAGFLIVFRKKQKNDSIPFIPFLVLSMCTSLLIS
ncbi:MAG: prepilin peptidase [Blautia sp.]